MISPSQGSNLKISRIQLSQQFPVRLVFVHLIQSPVQHIGGHGIFVVGKSYGNIAHDVADDGLD